MANALDILIKITAQATGVASVFNGTAQSARSLGQAATQSGDAQRGMASMTRQAREQAEQLQARMRATGSTLREASRDLGLTGDAAEDAARSYRMLIAAQRDEENAAKESARETKDSAEEAQEQAQSRFEGIRNAGVAMAAVGIGTGGLMLSAHLREVYEEGAGVERRLEAILKQQNRLGDLDTLNNGIQDVTVRGHFDDDDSLRDATVKLLSFSTQTKDTTELLELAARQARTMGTDVGGVAEQLGKVYGTGAGVAGLRRSGVTIDQADIDRIEKAYKMSKELGQAEFMTVIGAAIKNNSGALEDSLTESQAAANDAARALDEMQSNVGEGAAGAKTRVDALTASVLNAANSAPELEKLAGGFGYVGSIVLTAGGTVLGFLGQLGMARMGLQAMGITGVASFASIGTAAMGAATAVWAALAPLLPLILAIAVVALIAAAAIYAIDKAFHYEEDQELQANIEAGDATDQKRLDIANKYRKKKGQPELTLDEWKASEANDDGQPTGAAAVPGGDVAALQKQVAAIQQGHLSSPSPGAMPTDAGMGASVGVAESGAEGDIEELQDEVAQGRKGFDPNSASNRLRLAQRGERHQKAAERQRRAEQRALDRETKAQAKKAERDRKQFVHAMDAQAKENSDVELAQLEADTELRIKELEDAGASKLQIARVKADAEIRRGEIENAGAGSNDLKAERARKIARIKAQHMVDMAALEDDDSEGENDGDGEGKHGRKGSKQKRRMRLKNLLSYLRGGGSLTELPKGGAVDSAVSRATGDESRLDSGEARSSTLPDSALQTATARVQSQRYDEKRAVWIVKFEDLTLSNPMRGAASML